MSATKKTIIFRTHAIQRMFERHVTEEDVHNVLSKGIIVEEYPENLPYPSKLFLGWCEGRPIHVVAAFNVDDNEDIVVTVYEPTSTLWSPDFMRRK